MAELTAFGKETRKLRIDRGVSLMDMADQLGVSAAFVSSVETGRKNPPEEFVAQVSKVLKLDKNKAAELRKFALQSSSVVRLRPKPQNQVVVAEFARKFSELNKQEMEDILKILNRVPEK
jgi:transcriptional regulator with XRE-family HTH domain